MRRILAAFVLILLALPAAGWPALVQSEHAGINTRSHLFLYEDTSAANSALTVTTTAKPRGRMLRAVSVECSASTTVAVTILIRRAKVVSGTIDIIVPGFSITATTSAAAFSEIPLAPADLVVVDVPAGGAGITCTAQIIETSSDRY